MDGSSSHNNTKDVPHARALSNIIVIAGAALLMISINKLLIVLSNRKTRKLRIVRTITTTAKVLTSNGKKS